MRHEKAIRLRVREFIILAIPHTSFAKQTIQVYQKKNKKESNVSKSKKQKEKENKKVERYVYKA